VLWYINTAVGLLLTAAWLGLMYDSSYAALLSAHAYGRIGLWFIDHALYLKYYVLFLGVMTAWYFAWDISKLRTS